MGGRIGGSVGLIGGSVGSGAASTSQFALHSPENLNVASNDSPCEFVYEAPKQIPVVGYVGLVMRA